MNKGLSAANSAFNVLRSTFVSSLQRPVVGAQAQPVFAGKPPSVNVEIAQATLLIQVPNDLSETLQISPVLAFYKSARTVSFQNI